MSPGGLFLLWRRKDVHSNSPASAYLEAPSAVAERQRAYVRTKRHENAFERASTRRRVFSASFPTVLDDYVLRDFFVYLGMILATFLVLVLFLLSSNC